MKKYHFVLLSEQYTFLQYLHMNFKVWSTSLNLLIWCHTSDLDLIDFLFLFVDLAWALASSESLIFVIVTLLKLETKKIKKCIKQVNNFYINKNNVDKMTKHYKSIYIPSRYIVNSRKEKNGVIINPRPS